MRTWTPLQKKAGAAALVLVAALFPNLFMILVPVAALLAWAAGQTLIVGAVVGAVLVTGRRDERAKNSTTTTSTVSPGASA